MDPQLIIFLVFILASIIALLLYIGPDYVGQGFLAVANGFAGIFSGIGTGISGLLTNIGVAIASFGGNVGLGIQDALDNITSGEAMQQIICAFTNTESCMCGC